MATKKAKTTAKADTNKGINKIKNTATNVNKAVVATAGEVSKEMKENTKVVKNVAEKAAKELTKKVDFKDSTKKIKSTVNMVNTEVKETATVVADAVMKNGKQMTDNAVQVAKEAIGKINVEKGIQTVAKTAKNVNDYSLKTADQLIDSTLENSEKWAKVANKAINGGLKLAEKNQEMVFTTLETVKAQMINSANRFGKLFSGN